MIQALTIIIAICSIHSASDADRTDIVQKRCQKDLVECLIKSKGNRVPIELTICIKDRK